MPRPATMRLSSGIQRRRRYGEPTPFFPLTPRQQAIWNCVTAILRNQDRLYADQGFALEGLIDALETRLDFLADIRKNGRIEKRVTSDGTIRERPRFTSAMLPEIESEALRWLREFGLTPKSLANLL